MSASIDRLIRERVAAFPSLPNDALIDPRTVAALFSCSVETVKRRSRDGILPKPITLNANTLRFRAGEIRATLKRLSAERVAG